MFIFVFSKWYNSNINRLKHRWCAWNLNPGEAGTDESTELSRINFWTSKSTFVLSPEAVGFGRVPCLDVFDLPQELDSTRRGDSFLFRSQQLATFSNLLETSGLKSSTKIKSINNFILKILGISMRNTSYQVATFTDKWYYVEELLRCENSMWKQSTKKGWAVLLEREVSLNY